MSVTSIRRVVGCMTGTSIDGLDAALVEITGHGLQMRCAFVRGESADLGPLRAPLRDLAEQVPMTSGAIASLARDFSLLHARVVRSLLRDERCDLVCAHGQTVFHQPPLSWQLFEPAPLAHALGVPVVCNLRQGDLARGGQGAPITPIADAILFAHSGSDAVINLGGFCNATHPLAPDHAAGFDVCACNHVLDLIARESLGAPFDLDGTHALRGRVDQPGASALTDALRAQRAQHRSLGTGDELSRNVRTLRATLSPCDLAATACEAIARTIRDALPAGAARVLAAGGGVRNRALMRALCARFVSCQTTDAAGIPPELRESACFAVLGALCQDRIPITRTGAIAGSWTFP